MNFKSEITRIDKGTQRSRPKLKPRRQRRTETQQAKQAQRKNGQPSL